MNELFSKSIFSFCLCKSGEVSEKTLSAFEVKQCIGDRVLHTDNRTPLDYCRLDGRELIIFGYAVDVFSGQSEKLAETILKASKNIDEVIDCEKKLGGKYVVFYAENDSCFCLGDATCSVPVFYTTGVPQKVCCSNPQMPVNEFNLKKDSYLQGIRDSGDLGQAMPFDITTYKEINRLLPNHFLDINAGMSKRFVNSTVKQKKVSVEQAAELTAPMIENITKMFLQHFKIYCPLTAGKDSRVIYAYLWKLDGGKVDSYTIWQEGFNKDSQDWDIPVAIAKTGKTHHKQIYSVGVSEAQKQDMDSVLGENGYPQAAYDLTLTVNKYYGDGAVIEGDILGQLAQCHVHRNVPICFASPRYFRCKVHNYSDGARKLMKDWMKEVKASGERINILDLFSVENRLGVWAAHTNLVRNVVGQWHLNNLNSRSIIYIWTAIESRKRMNGALNIELIRKINPTLLDVEFEKDNKVKKVAKSNAMAFYLASFAKYYIEKRKFYAEKQSDKQI